MNLPGYFRRLTLGFWDLNGSAILLCNMYESSLKSFNVLGRKNNCIGIKSCWAQSEWGTWVLGFSTEILNKTSSEFHWHNT